MTTAKTLTMRATCSGVLILAAALPSAARSRKRNRMPRPPGRTCISRRHRCRFPRRPHPRRRSGRGRRPRFGVALEIGTTWPRDVADRRLVGKNASGGGGLSLQWDALRLERIATVSLDLGWLATESSTSQDFSGLQEDLKTNVFFLGLAVRHYLLPWLAPYGRIAGGIGWDNLTVGTGTGDFQDKRTFSQGSLGGGLFFRSPRLRLGASASAPHVGLMAHVEGGYILGTSSDFVLTSAPATATSTPISTSPVDIGKVGRDAPYLRISIGLAF